MASPFNNAATRSSVAVDRVYGALFDYLPMKAGDDRNAPHVPDPDRPQVTISLAPVDTFARGRSGPVRTPGVAAERPGHATVRQQWSCDRAALPYEPARTDRLRDPVSGALFQIAEIRRGDPARYVFDVNKIGAP